MDTTIRFVDWNADGCGTDIVNIAILTGPEVTEQVIASINYEITKYKTEIDEWTTDDILDAVSKYLEGIGYSIRWVTPTIDITY